MLGAPGDPEWFILPLLDHLPGVPEWIVTDRAYANHRCRHTCEMQEQNRLFVQAPQAPARCPDWIYTKRNIERRLSAQLEEW